MVVRDVAYSTPWLKLYHFGPTPPILSRTETFYARRCMLTASWQNVELTILDGASRLKRNCRNAPFSCRDSNRDSSQQYSGDKGLLRIVSHRVVACHVVLCWVVFCCVLCGVVVLCVLCCVVLCWCSVVCSGVLCCAVLCGVVLCCGAL